MHAGPVSPLLLLAIEKKVKELSEQALNVRTADALTYELKVRISTFQDVLAFAQGDTEKL